MIIVNFKNYKVDKEARKLAEKLDKVGGFIGAVNYLDIKEISFKTKLPVFAQHVDSPKKVSTGFIFPKEIKKVGAKGTLLNHSEHRISFDEIKKTILECNKYKLRVVVCVSNLSEAKKVLKLKPWAIAYEEPKLISSGKSITKYKADNIKKFVNLLNKTKVLALCGAGISSYNDFLESKILGCDGALIASALAKKNPDKFLKEFR